MRNRVEYLGNVSRECERLSRFVDKVYNGLLFEYAPSASCQPQYVKCIGLVKNAYDALDGLADLLARMSVKEKP